MTWYVVFKYEFSLLSHRCSYRFVVREIAHEAVTHVCYLESIQEDIQGREVYPSNHPSYLTMVTRL